MIAEGCSCRSAAVHMPTRGKSSSEAIMESSGMVLHTARELIFIGHDID